MFSFGFARVSEVRHIVIILTQEYLFPFVMNQCVKNEIFGVEY